MDAKITSEQIEPTMAYVLGCWFAQAEQAKAAYGAESADYAASLQTLWQGVCCLNRLALLCPDAVHANVVMGNYVQRVQRFIQRELGFTPSYILSESGPPFSTLRQAA